MVRPASPSFASHALQLLQRVQCGSSPVELVYTTHKRWPLPPGQFIYTRPTLRVSVLDSSFNPPTLAHLALADSPPPLSSNSVTSAELYDAQMLLLSVRNADKVMNPGDASFVERLEMMRLLSHNIRGNVAVAVVDEPTFVGKSTLLLHFLRTRLATVVSRTPPSPKLTFLLGFDTIVRLFSPRYYPTEQVMIQVLRTFLSPDQEDCHIVCAYRGNASAARSLEAGREFITNHRISFIDIGAKERTYSSTDVRARVSTGDETWRRLVADEVAAYIIEQGLYLSSEKEQ